MIHEIKLKRVCQKGPAALLIRRLASDWNESFCIYDAEGKLVIGTVSTEEERYPIELEGIPPVGWVAGGNHAHTLAALLSYVVQKELEGKSLAQETLSKYKELTLLYELGEKIAACLDIPDLLQLTLSEVKRLLTEDKGLTIGILLMEGESKQDLVVSAGQGEWFCVGEAFTPLDGITRQVLHDGHPEIVDNISRDPRYQAEPGRLTGLCSLLSLPLRTQDRTFGLLVVGSVLASHFQAADLKVLNVLASQTAMALGRAHLIQARVEQERLQASLKLSRSIQMNMLSTDFPQFSRNDPVELYAFMEPAREVSGDFYDFFQRDERTLLIAIGDVSDKGMPAALFMVMVKTLLRAMGQRVKEPHRLMEALNPELCRDNYSAMFVTLFLATLDIPTGRLTFSFGGHNPPLLLKKDGKASFIVGETGTALGILEDLPYTDQVLYLEKGDGVLLYTDGVSEAMNPEHEIFTEATLLCEMTGRGEENAQTLVERVLEAVRVHVQGAEQSDDITLLALRFGNVS